MQESHQIFSNGVLFRQKVCMEGTASVYYYVISIWQNKHESFSDTLNSKFWNKVIGTRAEFCPTGTQRTQTGVGDVQEGSGGGNGLSQLRTYVVSHGEGHRMRAACWGAPQQTALGPATFMLYLKGCPGCPGWFFTLPSQSISHYA